MILCLVFSRDRALQLEATLASFFRQAIDGDSAQVVVLYRTSSDRYKSQYAELEQEFRGQARFLAETQFRRQLLEMVSDVGGTRRDCPVMPWFIARYLPVRPSVRISHVLFAVDDALFVGPFHLGTAVDALQSNTDAVGFSLRLGRNTTHCYVLGRAQSLPEFEGLAGGVLKFSWTHGDGDFAYPLELSSSLYRAGDVVSLLRGIRFNDPNTLESEMSLHSRRFAGRAPFLLCWERSVAFSAPLNRVQDVYGNRSGSQPAFSVEKLGEAFDRGQRIDVQALDGFVPSACHQELPIPMKERTS